MHVGVYCTSAQVRLESSEQLLAELPLSPEQLQPYPTHEVLAMCAPASESPHAPVTTLAVHRDGHWLASGALLLNALLFLISSPLLPVPSAPLHSSRQPAATR